MPKIIKAVENVSGSENIVHRETSADIVRLSTSLESSLGADNVDEAMYILNRKVGDRVKEDDFNDLKTEVGRKAIVIDKISTIPYKLFVGKEIPCSVKVPVDGILESDTPIIGMIGSNDFLENVTKRDAWGCVSRITTSDGYITVYCEEELPISDINIQIKIIR